MTSESLFRKRMKQLLSDESISFTQFHDYHIYGLVPPSYRQRWRSIKAERMRVAAHITRLAETSPDLYRWLLGWADVVIRTKKASKKWDRQHTRKEGSE